MTTAEITKNTVFAQHTKKSATAYGRNDPTPHVVMMKDYRRIYQGGNSASFKGDFATKDEALAFIAEQGWVLVKTWKEAEALTADLRKADLAAYRETTDARKDKRQVQVERADGTRFVAWIEPEVADQIIEGYTQLMDKHRVVL